MPEAMGRIVAILALVLCVWTGAEVMLHGMHGAFGGLFVRLGVAAALEKSDGSRINSRSVPVKGAERMRGAHQRGIDRVDEALEGQ